MTSNQKDKYPQNKRSLKSYINFSNISNLAGLILVATLLFSPTAKGFMIEGLMKIGLFQPDMPKVESKSEVPLVTAPGPTEEVVFLDNKGNSIKLSDQKGKVVFINFWATWCPPCIAEMPTIDQLYAKYKNNKEVLFLMVDVDGKVDESTAFMNKNKFQLPVHIPGSDMPRALFAGSMPTTVILDKSGNIAFHHVGGADYSNPEVVDFINRLLN